MNLRVVVGVLLVIAGGIYLVTQGLFRSGDLDSVSASELAEISAYLSKGSVSSGKDPLFMGELQPAWDDLGFKDKYEEAERLVGNLRSRGYRRGYIKLRGRAVIDMGPTSMQIHDFPRGVRPKEQSRGPSQPDDLAPGETDP